MVRTESEDSLSEELEHTLSSSWQPSLRLAGECRHLRRAVTTSSDRSSVVRKWRGQSQRPRRRRGRQQVTVCRALRSGFAPVK
jgi:hypothetical protein